MSKQMDQATMDLYYQLSLMSGFVERAMNDLIIGFQNKDTSVLQKIVENDDLIDAKEKELERMCTVYLSRYTPVARDVREITGIFKIITDLERIGDQCSDIAEILTAFSLEGYIAALQHLPEMLETAKNMLKDSIDSYVLRDMKLAASMYRRDDKVDEFFDIISAEVVEELQKGTPNVQQCLDTLLIAKYVERIGDHCTNICEWISYNITGDRDNIDSYHANKKKTKAENAE